MEAAEDIPCMALALRAPLHAGHDAPVGQLSLALFSYFWSLPCPTLLGSQLQS